MWDRLFFYIFCLDRLTTILTLNTFIRFTEKWLQKFDSRKIIAEIWSQKFDRRNLIARKFDRRESLLQEIWSQEIWSQGNCIAGRYSFVIHLKFCDKRISPIRLNFPTIKFHAIKFLRSNLCDLISAMKFLRWNFCDLISVMKFPDPHSYLCTNKLLWETGQQFTSSHHPC